MPPVGLVAAFDPENGAVVLVDAGSPRVRAAYAQRTLALRLRATEVLDRAGVDLLELDTAEPFDLALVRFFRERARRVARAAG